MEILLTVSWNKNIICNQMNEFHHSRKMSKLCVVVLSNKAINQTIRNDEEAFTLQ